MAENQKICNTSPKMKTNGARLESSPDYDETSKWLCNLGFYRKKLPRTESCIFRAVADTRYPSQSYYSWVQRDLLLYTGAISPEDFPKYSLQTAIDRNTYLDSLENPSRYKPTLIDLVLISNMYGYNFKLYVIPYASPVEIFHSENSETIMIYSNLRKIYDLLYTEERSKRLAFIQHYIFEIYYKLVFKLENVDYAVNKMLGFADSPIRLVPGYSEMDAEGFISNINTEHKLLPLNAVYARRFEMRAKCSNMRVLLDSGITPFPYRVAKALHPDFYRNIEFDAWFDQKRPKTGLDIWCNSRITPGVCCKVRLGELRFPCIIQEVYYNGIQEAKIYVIRENLGRMMKVPLSLLEPQEENQVVVALRRYLKGNNATGMD